MTSHNLPRSSEHCPRCGSVDNAVTDSRPSPLGRRRRRRCTKCHTAWTTVELAHTLVYKLVRVLNYVSPMLLKTEAQIQEMRTMVLDSIANIDNEGKDDG